ncbi:MAG: cytidylate kinase-like family protein [Clostridia bacterium]|nr:cytidylate kinase-like family protein [Clostridia bacterium]
MKRIITISRQFGSGGRTIGAEVAKKLGIPYYNHDIIARASEKIGLSPEYIEKNSEDKGSASNWFGNAMAAMNPIGTINNGDLVWATQKKIVEQVAAEGPCVIVGRCADYILKDRDDVIKVFVYAPKAFRANRIVEIYGATDEMPEKRLKRMDKRRAAYYRYYTDMEWGEAKNYDLCLNSGALGIEKCEDILVDLYKTMK